MGAPSGTLSRILDFSRQRPDDKALRIFAGLAKTTSDLWDSRQEHKQQQSGQPQQNKRPVQQDNRRVARSGTNKGLTLLGDR